MLEEVSVLRFPTIRPGGLLEGRQPWPWAGRERPHAAGLYTFTITSLFLVVVTAIAIGMIQSTYLTRAILEREGALLRDFIAAIVHPTDGASEPNWAALQQLRNFPETVRAAAFDRTGQLVWWDGPAMPGWHAANPMVEGALAGEIMGLFLAAAPEGRAAGMPPEPLVEFYVPIRRQASGSAGHEVVGVLEFYRYAGTLEATLQAGRHLVWTIVGLAGTVLYLALFTLFWLVYRRKEQVEIALAELSSSHASIVQVEKLSAIGQMIGEVAHQLNNPLVGVINLAQLARRQLPRASPAMPQIDEIEAAGQHCRDYVARLLSFTKLAQLDLLPVDLRQVVEDAVMLVTRSLGPHAGVQVELPDRPVMVTGDGVLLRHAVFNLLANAHQHGDPARPATIEIVPHEVAHRIVVTDSGQGLTQAVKERLFTPFFTTRPDGTGLGLVVVRQILARHGGSVEATDAPDGGARFILRLPVLGDRA